MSRTSLRITIRPAVKSDLIPAEMLERASFTHYALSARQLRYHQQKDNSIFLVAEHRNQLVGDGIALIRRHKTGLTGRIYSLVVSEELRGQGIGGRLFAALIAALQSRGVNRIYLEVEKSNQGAIQLYEKAGFRWAGVLHDYYSRGKHAVKMVYSRARGK